MIANFFNKTKPAVFLTKILILLIYVLAAAFIFKFNTYSASIFGEIFGFFLLIVLLLSISKFIIKKNRLTKDNSYSLLLIIIIIGTFHETMFDLNLILANIALLLNFRKVYSLRAGTNIKEKLFDAGFWVGIAMLISVWSAVFVLFIYVGMILYNKVDFKNIFIPIIGVATPIFLFFTYCLFIGDMQLFNNVWLFEYSLDYSSYSQLKYLVPIVFYAIIMLWSIILIFPKLTTMGVGAKKSWQLGFNHLVLAFLVIAFFPIKNGAEALFIIFPLAVINANFIQIISSNRIKNIVLILFFGISIGAYFL